MADREDVCVLVPTREEAETIGDVLDRLAAEGFEDVLVIDGHSTDDTREIAEERGARVIKQTGLGKGQAVREGLAHVDAEYVLMMDGDGTYRPEEAGRLLEQLWSGPYEHVIGDRFADMSPGAMTRLNRAGNRLINGAFRLVHGQDHRDVLSGYRAFTARSAERFDLRSKGFGIETELSVECVKHGVPTTVVPITYEPRPDAAETNLRPFRDGAAILLTLYRLARTNNPLFYFGSVGLLSGGIGVVVAAYVAVEWFTRRVPHEVLAVVAAFAILLGVQLAMFGVLSDLIVTLHREQLRLWDRQDRRLSGGPPSPGLRGDGSPTDGTAGRADGTGGRTDETGERPSGPDERVAGSGDEAADGGEHTDETDGGAAGSGERAAETDDGQGDGDDADDDVDGDDIEGDALESDADP